jgi:hypothetical protein
MTYIYDLLTIMGPAFWPLLACTYGTIYGSIRYIAAARAHAPEALKWKRFINNAATASQAAGFYGTAYSMLKSLAAAPGAGENATTNLTVMMSMAMGTTAWGLMAAMSVFFVTMFTPLFVKDAV